LRYKARGRDLVESAPSASLKVTPYREDIVTVRSGTIGMMLQARGVALALACCGTKRPQLSVS